MEVECLIPLKFKCNKLILVGDPEQLPATVLSKRAQDNGLAQSLFERVYQCFRFSDEENPIKMLYVQYRMHPSICEFPSANFYKGRLRTSDETAKNRSSCNMEHYMVFNLANSEERVEDETAGSIYNPVEAEAIIELCKYFIRKRNDLSVGIISPYQRQTQYLKELLAKK